MKRGRDTPMEGINTGKGTHEKRQTQGMDTYRGYIRGKDTHGAKPHTGKKHIGKRYTKGRNIRERHRGTYAPLSRGETYTAVSEGKT